MWPLPTPDATFRSVLDALDPLVVMASVRDESSSIIDFTIEFMNDAASRLFVDPGGSLIGRRMLDVFPAHVGSGLFDAYRRVAESGEPLLTEELFDVGKTCSWFEVRICQLGEGVISMSHDISEHRAAEANARAQELMLQATFDAFLNPHVLVNAVRDEVGKIIDFVYVDANQKACEYNRIPREQLIGARVMDLLPGHAGAGLLAMYSHVVET
ncbi:MAG: PAS domain-containing protein, partial [Actinomycetota bacterium]